MYREPTNVLNGARDWIGGRYKDHVANAQQCGISASAGPEYYVRVYLAKVIEHQAF